MELGTLWRSQIRIRPPISEAWSHLRWALSWRDLSTLPFVQGSSNRRALSTATYCLGSFQLRIHHSRSNSQMTWTSSLSSISKRRHSGTSASQTLRIVLQTRSNEKERECSCRSEVPQNLRKTRMSWPWARWVCLRQTWLYEMLRERTMPRMFQPCHRSFQEVLWRTQGVLMESKTTLFTLCTWVKVNLALNPKAIWFPKSLTGVKRECKKFPWSDRLVALQWVKKRCWKLLLTPKTSWEPWWRLLPSMVALLWPASSLASTST